MTPDHEGDAPASVELREEIALELEPFFQQWLDWCGENGEDPEAYSGARTAVDALIAPGGRLRATEERAKRAEAERNAWVKRWHNAQDDKLALTQRITDLEGEGKSLLARLREFENEHLSESQTCEWYGHVKPPLSRFAALLLPEEYAHG